MGLRSPVVVHAWYRTHIHLSVHVRTPTSPPVCTYFRVIKSVRYPFAPWCVVLCSRPIYYVHGLVAEELSLIIAPT